MVDYMPMDMLSELERIQDLENTAAVDADTYQPILSPVTETMELTGSEDIVVSQIDGNVSTWSTHAGSPKADLQHSKVHSSPSFDIEVLKAQRAAHKHHMQQIQHVMKQELRWLQRTMQKTPDDIRQCLVSHRGFHHVDDGASRPLENTVTAFTRAWAEGVVYCECDVTVLLDGNVVLSHDDDLSRLRLSAKSSGPNHGGSNTELVTMNFGDVLRQPLKNGVNAPLLATVLHHATALDGKLIVELKPGSTADAMVKVFTSDANALRSIAVVMSFDLALIQEFKRRYIETGLPKDSRPKVLLLTIAKLSDPVVDFEYLLAPEDFSTVRKKFNDSIDGVFVEWTPELLAEHRVAFTQLCSEIPVGVWQYSGDSADCIRVAGQLAQCGAAFINTDFPYSFMS